VIRGFTLKAPEENSDFHVAVQHMTAASEKLAMAHNRHRARSV
jgi:hypothetical protein